MESERAPERGRGEIEMMMRQRRGRGPTAPPRRSMRRHATSGRRNRPPSSAPARRASMASVSEPSGQASTRLWSFANRKHADDQLDGRRRYGRFDARRRPARARRSCRDPGGHRRAPSRLRPDRRRQRVERRHRRSCTLGRRGGGRRAATRLRRGMLGRPARGDRRRRVLHGLRRLVRRRRPRTRRRTGRRRVAPIWCSAPARDEQARGRCTPGSRNRLLAAELRRRTHVRLRDLGPMRAARRVRPARRSVSSTAGSAGRWRWCCASWQAGWRIERGRGRLLPACRPIEGDRHDRRHRACRSRDMARLLR